MNKQQVVDYILKTPQNTNPTIISQMLDEFGVSDNKEEIELSATTNNIYTPEEGKVYKKVTVNVPTIMPSAIDIDFNDGTGPEYVTHVVVPMLYGDTFSANDWWEDMQSSITPPIGKTYQCLATVPTDPTESQIITTIDIENPTYYLYIIWQTAAEEPLDVPDAPPSNGGEQENP